MGAPVALGALSLSPRQEYRKPKVKNDRPAYGVINNGFYDNNDKFWHAGQSLYFDGEPNQNLFPLNKLAYDKIQAFLDVLDMFGEEAAKNAKPKRAYVRQKRDEWNDGDEVDLPQPEYVMGYDKKKDGHANDEIR